MDIEQLKPESVDSLIAQIESGEIQADSDQIKQWIDRLSFIVRSRQEAVQPSASGVPQVQTAQHKAVESLLHADERKFLKFLQTRLKGKALIKGLCDKFGSLVEVPSATTSNDTVTAETHFSDGMRMGIVEKLGGDIYVVIRTPQLAKRHGLETGKTGEQIPLDQFLNGNNALRIKTGYEAALPFEYAKRGLSSDGSTVVDRGLFLDSLTPEFTEKIARFIK